MIRTAIYLEAETPADLGPIVMLLQALQTNNKPTQIVLGQPVTLRQGKLIVTTIVNNLPNDVTVYRPILDANMGGIIVPFIAGDAYSVAMGAPTAQSGTGAPLNAVIGPMPATDVNGVALPNAGATCLIENCLNMTFTGVVVTVTDKSGLTAYVETVNGVADLTPTTIVLGPAVNFPQAAPTT